LLKANSQLTKKSNTKNAVVIDQTDPESSGDPQLVSLIDDFLHELHRYESLQNSPREKEEELLRMIQPFYVLSDLVTEALSEREQHDTVTSLGFLLERVISIEETFLKTIDENEKRIITEVQNSTQIIVGTINARFVELMGHLSTLGEQQLQKSQESVEEAVQKEIDRIQDNEKKEEARRRWNQLKKMISAIQNMIGLIASMIQIYQFIEENRIDLVYNEVQILLNNLLEKLT
jgi:hypothetical protein